MNPDRIAVPGFYYARLSNLSGDPAIDAAMLIEQPFPKHVVYKGEVFYVRAQESAEEDRSRQHLSLEPVQQGSFTRYIPAGNILSLASPCRVMKALDGNLGNANKSISQEIGEFVSLGTK